MMDGALLFSVYEEVESLKLLWDQLYLANVWRTLAIILNRLLILGKAEFLEVMRRCTSVEASHHRTFIQLSHVLVEYLSHEY